MQIRTIPLSCATHENNAYEQTKQIIKNIEMVLLKINASLSDVVRTRIFVTDILDWKQIGKAHQEAFGDTLPAATMVEVKGLIRPEFRVEMEADAVVFYTKPFSVSNN
ncbi:MAG: Rid family hydrolase [Nitrososphaerota archaeon]